MSELLLGDHERRRDLQRDTAQRAREHAALERLGRYAVRSLAFDLYRAEQADRPHLADEVVPLERPQRGLQPRFELTHALDEPLRLDHVEIRKRDGARGCVAGVRVAVPKQLRSALLPERL